MRLFSIMLCVMLLVYSSFPLIGENSFVYAEGETTQEQSTPDVQEQSPEDSVSNSNIDAENSSDSFDESDGKSAEEAGDDNNPDTMSHSSPKSTRNAAPVPTDEGSSTDSPIPADDGDEFYYVTINVIDEGGTPIADPTILFERLHTSYASSMTQKIQPENGKYKVDCGEGFAICYIEVSAEGFEKKTLNLDPREMSGLTDEREGTITVALKRAKDTTVKRNLRFRVVDTKGIEIAGAELTLERNNGRGYNYDAMTPVSAMDYTVEEMGYNGVWFYWQYRFRASATGYASVTGDDFSFKSSYYNSFFDPATTSDPIVVTVTLKSDAEVLEEARTNAINQLKNYKNRNNYRSGEQQQYDQIITEYTNRLKAAATHSEINIALEEGKRKLAALKTAADYENEELVQNIYFHSGITNTNITADENGVFTIKDTDSGNFYMKKPGGGTYANDTNATWWRCEVKIQSGSSISWNYVIGAYGQYQPRVLGGPYPATVEIRETGKTVHFKVLVVKEKIDRLRAIVDGKDVSEGTVHVLGSEGKKATIQGHIQDTDTWKTLPINAIEFINSGAVSVDHSSGEFRAWGTSGTMTYSLTTDPSVKVSFNVVSDPVPVMGLNVSAPEVYYIDLWDTLSGTNVGIPEGDPGESGRYHVSVFPDNATNPAVTWRALTPDIATQSDIHSAGIVPKKAGLAEFVVTSVDNPKISTTVKILFKYKNPLKTAQSDQSVYYLSVGETRNFNIITNGQIDSSKGATEQRFHWSYNTSGVASVKDKVSASGRTKTFTHQIYAENEGVVYVTGMPYDTSEGCSPVKFKVIVTENAGSDRAAAKGVEDMINSIGDVTLDKKTQVENARKAFNRLTAVQKDMVDDDVYAKLVAAELKIRQLEKERKKKDEGGGGKDTKPEDDGGKGSASTDSGNPGDDSTPAGGDMGDAVGGDSSTGGDPGDGGRPEVADDTANKTAATKASENAAAKTIQKTKSKSSKARQNKGKSEDSILMREAVIDKVDEDAKDTVNRPNIWISLILLFIFLDALLYGAGRKYKEFRLETR